MFTLTHQTARLFTCYPGRTSPIGGANSPFPSCSKTTLHAARSDFPRSTLCPQIACCILRFVLLAAAGREADRVCTWHTLDHTTKMPPEGACTPSGGVFLSAGGVRTLGETWMAGMPVRYPCCSSERGSAWRNGKTALRRRFRPDPDRRLLRCCRLGYDGLFPLRSWFWGSGGERPDGGLLVAWWSSVARQSAACSWMWPVEGPIFALRQQMSILRHIPSGWEFVEM